MRGRKDSNPLREGSFEGLLRIRYEVRDNIEGKSPELERRQKGETYFLHRMVQDY